MTYATINTHYLVESNVTSDFHIVFIFVVLTCTNMFRKKMYRHGYYPSPY